MTRRDRRALLVGGLTVFIAVVAIRVAPACLRTIEVLRARAAGQATALQQARATVLSTAAIRDSLAAALNELVLVAPKLVGRGTPAVAGASLSGAVTLAAERGRLRVLQLNPLADSVGAVFGTVNLHAELEGDISGLAQFLAELESGETVLSVELLVVRTADLQRALRAPEALRIEVDIRGLFLVEAGA